MRLGEGVCWHCCLRNRFYCPQLDHPSWSIISHPGWRFVAAYNLARAFWWDVFDVSWWAATKVSERNSLFPVLCEQRRSVRQS